MRRHSEAAWERAMKVQEVILRAMAKRIPWWQAAEIIGISDRSLRRLRQRYEQYGCDGLLERRRRASPKRVGEPRAEEVDLRNGITVSVWPCSFRSIRGISIVCAICDELAFWRDDLSGANPAEEVLRAIRPEMASFPDAKLIKITSPYAKSGLVWEDFRTRLEEDERLVWRLDTATMNPTIDGKFLQEEETRDPEYYAREYLAEFWESASALLPSDQIETCVVRERYQLPPVSGKGYVASLDAAFRGDNFAFCIVQNDGEGKITQDIIKSWRGSRAKPVDLAATLGDIVAPLRLYGISKIHGDSFCSEPIRQALAAQGIACLACGLAQLDT